MSDDGLILIAWNAVIELWLDTWTLVRLVDFIANNREKNNTNRHVLKVFKSLQVFKSLGFEKTMDFGLDLTTNLLFIV